MQDSIQHMTLELHFICFFLIKRPDSAFGKLDIVMNITANPFATYLSNLYI